jgi:hypothetical protein
VEEALRLGVSDAAAVLHILHMPDADERKRYALALSEEQVKVRVRRAETVPRGMLMSGAPLACWGHILKPQSAKGLTLLTFSLADLAYP